MEVLLLGLRRQPTRDAITLSRQRVMRSAPAISSGQPPIVHDDRRGVAVAVRAGSLARDRQRVVMAPHGAKTMTFSRKLRGYRAGITALMATGRTIRLGVTTTLGDRKTSRDM
jgi:hypothetical protein